jgi:alpha-L-fucosidase
MRHREQLREMVTQYGQVDILSFDHGLPYSLWPELKDTLKMIRNHQPDVMMRTRGIGNYGDYYTPEGWRPKQSMEGIPWSSIRGLTMHSRADRVIKELATVCAIGGTMQWNAHPRHDGSFLPGQIAQMKKVGEWLELNGEAIYATRPWKVNIEEAVCFTRSKDSKKIYAIVTAWPGNGQALTIKALSKKNSPDVNVTGVSLLGHEGKTEWKQDEAGLKVTFPDKKPCDYAYVLKVE